MVATPYATPLARPIRSAFSIGAPPPHTTKILTIIAGITARATTALPASLPSRRTVKSVATTTIGNVNAATASGNSPKNGISAPGNKLNLNCTR